MLRIHSNCENSLQWRAINRGQGPQFVTRGLPEVRGYKCDNCDAILAAAYRASKNTGWSLSHWRGGSASARYSLGRSRRARRCSNRAQRCSTRSGVTTTRPARPRRSPRSRTSCAGRRMVATLLTSRSVARRNTCWRRMLHATWCFSGQSRMFVRE